jgi:AcrR family transcriptional regulator
MTSVRSDTLENSSVARRTLLLRAARGVIEEHGPGALTGQIAERAGVARPNVYRHFHSKDELDSAVACDAQKELRAAILARFDLTGTFLDGIRAAVTAQVTWADQHPNLYRFLISRGHQRHVERRRGDRGAFAAELAAAGARYIPRFGDDRPVAEAVVVGIIGLVDASVVHWLDRRGSTRDQLIERLANEAWLIIDLHFEVPQKIHTHSR